MFGPQHVKHIIAYFDGIDHELSRRMIRKNPPDEPALTNELCALLDAETQNTEKLLDYSLEQLNADLAACGDGLDLEIKIDTYPHNSAMERYVSQSDFGLVLEVDNKILPQENWFAAFLVQAKRLFRNPNSGEYDQKSSFQAVDAEQQLRLDRLARVIGEDALDYCLYCPPISALSDTARMQARALHNRNLHNKIFDYSGGLALRDALVQTGGINAGLWFRPIAYKPSTLLELHGSAFRTALPLTWYIIQYFIPAAGGRHREQYRAPEHSHRHDYDRVRRIVTGDEQAIRDLIRELADAGEESEAPAHIRVLPRHTLTIKVSVGRSLPPETARVFFD